MRYLCQVGNREHKRVDLSIATSAPRTATGSVLGGRAARLQKMGRGVAGWGAALLFTGGSWFRLGGDEVVLIVIKVSDDDALLSHWPSKPGRGDRRATRCPFWNRSVVYSQTLCSHLPLVAPVAPARARQRAMAPAPTGRCILSPE